MEKNYSVIETGNIPRFLTNGNDSLGQLIPRRSTGTKVVAGVLAISTVGALGYGFVAYALPAIMSLISPVIAGILSFFSVLFAVSMIKPASKWFTAIADKLYKSAIRYNPEVAVENKINSFDEMANIFKAALAKIKESQAQFKTLASDSEKQITTITDRMEKSHRKLIDLRKEKESLSAKVKTLKADIDSGKLRTQKERAPYYDALEDLTRVSKEIDRISSDANSDQTVLKMNKDLVEKYAAKAHIFADWISFLDRGADQIENKKRELKVWWDAIKKEISVANAGKDATNALQYILRDVNGKEYDFNVASEYIIDKINSDYSITVQNMSDLKRHVEGLDFNSDDTFNSLEKMLNDINSGEIAIPSAIEISSPAHKLTHEERQAAGVLGNLFDD